MAYFHTTGSGYHRSRRRLCRYHGSDAGRGTGFWRRLRDGPSWVNHSHAKVLGASIANIARIINAEFMVIFVISALCGVAMSYFAVDALMSGIWRYYQPATTTTFIVSGVLMFFVSAIAIGSKVYSAASMNPVKTLRDEWKRWQLAAEVCFRMPQGVVT